MNGNGKITTVDNYIGGKFVPPTTGNYLDVLNPANGHVIGKVGLSESDDVQTAVETANAAFPSWSKLTIKARAAIVSPYLFFLFFFSNISFFFLFFRSYECQAGSLIFVIFSTFSFFPSLLECYDYFYFR